ncbi:MAG: 2-oxo acid dehydrogenase subunit E2 [Sphingobacteriales bacterium]|nr:MAG: 2-oxo acid dehydrogenase subunit E2 [Sphingobacteriales bacterium]
MSDSKTIQFPDSRIATNDVCAVGLNKHHIAAMIEIDVTKSREKIKSDQLENRNISFTAWLVKTISITVKEYENVAAYLKGKRNLIVFNDINVSILVEKEIKGHSVPIPLIINKANERSIESIANQINEARKQPLTKNDLVLEKKSNRLQQLYFRMPGFIRRFFWRYLLHHPQLAFNNMGNVGITSVGMIGHVNGWFIPISVHPICFGIGRITKKPIVIEDSIVIREVLNMTVLLDHDVVDGAQMARFISKLTENIENGEGLF